MGYEVIEQNASDVRNKIAVEGLLNHLTDNTLVSFSKQKASTNKVYFVKLLFPLSTLEIPHFDGRG